VLIQLSTPSGRRVAEWRYRSTFSWTCTSSRWVLSFTPLPLYPWAKSPLYPFDKSLGGPHSRSGGNGDCKFLSLPGLELSPLCRPARLLYWGSLQNKKRGLYSASELHRLSDHDWSANLVATFADRGVSRGQRGGSHAVVNLSFLAQSRYFSFK
jgi:hypothetical protein